MVHSTVWILAFLSIFIVDDSQWFDLWISYIFDVSMYFYCIFGYALHCIQREYIPTSVLMH